MSNSAMPIKLNICKRSKTLPESSPSAMIINVNNPPRQEACRSGRNLNVCDLCQADVLVFDKQQHKLQMTSDLLELLISNLYL